MRLSCKLSNSTICFIESEGLDANELLMELPWSETLLFDPGQTLEAKEMEFFLNQFLNWWEQKKGPLESRISFLKKIGHESINNRSWGTLDSVLRMMPDVFEVWQRPSKLLGHFVDQEPIVTDLRKDREVIEFKWAGAPAQFPLSFSVLLGCLEVLPKYMGSQLALCHWSDGVLSIKLNSQTSELNSPEVRLEAGHHDTSLELYQQPTLVTPSVTEVALSNEEALFHSLILSPEAFREMVAVVEKPLKPKLKAKHKTDEPSFPAPEQLTLHSSFGEPEFIKSAVEKDEDLDNLQQNLSRILDFFVRATQLVTLMAQQDPEKAKKWMKRLNWERVQDEFPGLVEESVTLVKQLKSQED